MNNLELRTELANERLQNLVFNSVSLMTEHYQSDAGNGIYIISSSIIRNNKRVNETIFLQEFRTKEDVTKWMDNNDTFVGDNITILKDAKNNMVDEFVNDEYNESIESEEIHGICCHYIINDDVSELS